MHPYTRYPRIAISFCARCKWHNRAVWYVQEIMQTFGDPEKGLFVAEVALQPSYDEPGLFEIILERDAGSPQILYKRRLKKTNEPQNEEYYFDGFPDSKFVKQLVRNALFPEKQLGHIDKYSEADLLGEGMRKIPRDNEGKNDGGKEGKASEGDNKGSEGQNGVDCEKCKAEE